VKAGRVYKKGLHSRGRCCFDVRPSSLRPVPRTSRDISSPVANQRRAESIPHNFPFARQNEAAGAADAAA